MDEWIYFSPVGFTRKLNTLFHRVFVGLFDQGGLEYYLGMFTFLHHKSHGNNLILLAAGIAH